MSLQVRGIVKKQLYRSLYFQVIVALIAGIAVGHFYPKFAADMSDLPPACKAELQPLKTPEEVADRIAQIPTRLGLSSECDRQLIYVSATKLVAQYRDQILEYLDQP